MFGLPRQNKFNITSCTTTTQTCLARQTKIANQSNLQYCAIHCKNSIYKMSNPNLHLFVIDSCDFMQCMSASFFRCMSCQLSPFVCALLFRLVPCLFSRLTQCVQCLMKIRAPFPDNDGSSFVRSFSRWIFRTIDNLFVAFPETPLNVNAHSLHSRRS